MANALLRTLIKVQAHNEPSEHAPIAILADYLSHPEWLINKWIKDQDYDRAKRLAEWNNQTPSLWFRVNLINYTPGKFKIFLNKEQIVFKGIYVLKLFLINNSSKSIIEFLL